MELVRIVEAAGGIMPTDALRDEAGVSRHIVDRAVGAGILDRPARGWVSTMSADPALVAAVEVGVVVTCVTRAARVGLWDVHEPRVHVAARPGRPLRRPTSAHVHWARPLLPRHPGRLEDSLENTLNLVAECQPYEKALTVWESALNRGLTTFEHLGTLAFGAKGRRLRADAQPYSDSGVETVVVPRLRWLGLRLRRQVWLLGHRVDLLIGDRLILQIDGGHHVDEQRMIDNEHDAKLRLAGYHVIRVGYWQVMGDWPRVQDLIIGAVARGLHLAK
ncbi:endonuclease domain-containing protein [Microbacterium sp. JB110]|uniref:endonuclease domain-containing protein n=1 Tax=Microbacterium sp. JB110 TaxID=2024477 RepID=UPI000B3647EB|nr:DUF559 domain-containing protein [Microbacterium sp. JB110]RCS62841.1 DUF559 domain-containing protein [Microbacterium sp. JB110]